MLGKFRPSSSAMLCRGMSSSIKRVGVVGLVRSTPILHAPLEISANLSIFPICSKLLIWDNQTYDSSSFALPGQLFFQLWTLISPKTSCNFYKALDATPYLICLQGLMGHGIAQITAMTGYEVLAIEANDAALKTGIARCSLFLKYLLIFSSKAIILRFFAFSYDNSSRKICELSIFFISSVSTSSLFICWQSFFLFSPLLIIFFFFSYLLPIYQSSYFLPLVFLLSELKVLCRKL